jgi:hypothetical protein
VVLQPECIFLCDGFQSTHLGSVSRALGIRHQLRAKNGGLSLYACLILGVNAGYCC